jgi:hypothetical protein
MPHSEAISHTAEDRASATKQARHSSANSGDPHSSGWEAPRPCNDPQPGSGAAHGSDPGISGWGHDPGTPGRDSDPGTHVRGSDPGTGRWGSDSGTQRRGSAPGTPGRVSDSGTQTWGSNPSSQARGRDEEGIRSQLAGLRRRAVLRAQADA